MKNFSLIKINKSHHYLIYGILIFCYLYFLNALFPTQSDDLGAGIGGIKEAANAYMNWNGRFGEMLKTSFGSWFSTTSFYPIVNAFMGTAFLILIFKIIFARLPHFNFKDTSIFLIFLVYLMIIPTFSFGSVFYWAAGSFNYLWIWVLILLHLLPYRLFTQKVILNNEQINTENKRNKNLILNILFLIISFLAGWGTEFGIVFCLFHLSLIIYLKFIKKQKLDFFYYARILAFFAGWCFLYASPGMHLRTVYFSEYLSLSQILSLNITDFIKRIFYVYSQNNARVFEPYIFILLLLFLFADFYKPKSKTKIFLYSFPALYFISIRKFTILFFIYTIILCLYFAIKNKNNNRKFSYILFLVIFVLVAHFVFTGALIQIVHIPPRARFQYSLLNLILIAVSMNLSFDNLKTTNTPKTIFKYCAITSFIVYSFVAFECFHMRYKWNKMIVSVNQQKNAGIKNVIVDKKTFKSKWKGYGDWGNPGYNVKEWPNTSYARFFNVETFMIK